MVQVLMFGHLRDTAGWSEKSMAADSVNCLLEQIRLMNPILHAQLDQFSVAVIVNDVIRRNDFPLAGGDEVAFLPPMSGG